MADFISSIVGPMGGAFLGFIGGVVQQRTSREARFETRIDAELAALRVEVAACREERTEFAIIKMGTGMLAGELRRMDPYNGTLQAVVDAFAALPPEREDFCALLAKLTGSDDAPHEQAD